MQVWELPQRQKTQLLTYLLYKNYQDEFRVIDGLNQHPDGLTFEQWIDKILDED